MAGVQPSLFDRGDWTKEEAETWLSANGFKPVRKADLENCFSRYPFIEAATVHGYSELISSDGGRYILCYK